MNLKKRQVFLVSAGLLSLLFFSVNTILTDTSHVFASDSAEVMYSIPSNDTLLPEFGEVDVAEGMNYTTTNALPTIYKLLL